MLTTAIGCLSWNESDDSRWNKVRRSGDFHAGFPQLGDCRCSSIHYPVTIRQPLRWSAEFDAPEHAVSFYVGRVSSRRTDKIPATITKPPRKNEFILRRSARGL